jgi:YVTN family beta-propeller protein
MRTTRSIALVALFVAVAALLPLLAQTLIGTVNVGVVPGYLLANTVTNKIYVENICGSDPNCASPGSITVIDGATDQATNIPVGNNPQFMVMNTATNKLYVTNRNDGTVSVINGATNQVIKTITVGPNPVGADANPLTNRIYITNYGNRKGNTVSIIDGNADQVIATVTVQYAPIIAAVNPVTNKIYVVNRCATDGNDCYYDGSGTNSTLSVIDGATNAVSTTVTLGKWSSVMLLNTVTNKIYVGNSCGNDSSCMGSGSDANTIGTINAIDGVTLATSTVTAGKGTTGMTVNTVANQIYMTNATDNTMLIVDGATLNTMLLNVGTAPADVEVNPATFKIYVTNNGDNTLSMIDGINHNQNTIGVGSGPASATVNPITNRIYVINSNDNTVSVIAGGSSDPVEFVPVPPCRVIDTRQPHDNPIPAKTFRDFDIPTLNALCGIPANAAAYALNVTAIPTSTLHYLTIWPTGETQPVASTLNSDGRTKANAAIVPAGAGGAVRIYVTDTTDVLLDINGYFIAANGSTLQFYPLTPCRVVDTRGSSGPLGGPEMMGGVPRDFPVLQSRCPIPNTAQAYSMNFTVVTNTPVRYLTVWPTGQGQPTVSTLNDRTGTNVANAGIVPAGTGGDIDAFVTDDTNLLIDINGYFAAPGPSGLSLYTSAPCRVLDTRNGNGYFSGELTVNVVASPCTLPNTAQAYVFNATVVPQVKLGYLTLWQDGVPQPGSSTLNAGDGVITSNMAVVPTTNGKIDAFASSPTQLILDISSFFAP